MDREHNTMKKDSGIIRFLFAVFGFIAPIIGLILFLVYEEKHRSRAMAAGKGAIASVAVRAVVIIAVIIFSVFSVKLSLDMVEPYIDDILNEPIEEDYYISAEEVLGNNAEISYGKYTVAGSKEGYLDVTVKNTADERCTFQIEVEAIDENGETIDTDYLFIIKLDAGQSTTAKAFDYVVEDSIKKLKNASFKVSKVDCYVS